MLRKLAGESLTYGLASALQRLGGLILLPLSAHAFSPEQLGTLGLALTTSTLLSTLVTLGLDNSAHRWFWDSSDVIDRKRTIAAWLWFQLGISASAGLLLGLVSPLLAGPLLGSREQWPLLAILGAGIPLSVVGLVAGNWLRMQRRAASALTLAGLFVLVQVGGTFALVLGLDSGVVGYCSAQVAAGAVASVAGLIFMVGWTKPAPGWWPRLREMLVYALPLIPASLAIWAMTSFNRYALQGLSGTAEVGLFQLGSSIGMALTLGTGAFQQAWGPFALSIHQQEGHGRVYARVFLWVLWGGCTLACLFAAGAPLAVWLLASPSYAPASVVVGPVALTCTLGALGYVLAIGPGIAKDNRPVAWAVILGGLVAVIGNLLLIPLFHLDGAAAAGVLGQCASLGFLYRRAQRIRPYPYAWRIGLVVLAVTLAIQVVIRLLIPIPGSEGLMLRLMACLPILSFGAWLWRHAR